MEDTIKNIEAEIARIQAVKKPLEVHHTVLALLGAAVERLKRELPAPAEETPAASESPAS